MVETQAFVCSHVFHDTRPILLVAREDGDWMFLCGDLHDEGEEYHLVGMNHLIERDLAINEVLLLPDGFEAERPSVGADWRWSEITSDEG
jgi:hypothetical protein